MRALPHRLPEMLLHCAGRVLDLSCPRVMGVLNITPDSFSDGGELLLDARPRIERVLRRAARMMAGDRKSVV